jgi:hypothetical protein
MTHEEFMKLNVGDVLVYLFGDKWEIIVTKGSSPKPCENNHIKCRNLNDQSILEFRRRNGLWQIGTSHNDDCDWWEFNLSDLNIVSKKSSEHNSIEHFQKKVEETKSELVRLENTLKGLEDSKIQNLLMKLVPGKIYTVKTNNRKFTGKFVYQNYQNSKNTFTFAYPGTTTEYVFYREEIKEIILRYSLSEEFRILVEKIELANKES